MSRLREGIRQYLTLRARLGFELRDVRWALGKFVEFLEAEGASYITTALAVRWATQSTSIQPATCAWRLGTVRRFATWFSALDSRTEVPPQGLLPYRYQRQRPYIYSTREIERIVGTAGMLPSPRDLRGRTYSTLFGLLAVTGMRVSEALYLDRDDVDLGDGILCLRKPKYRKSRLVYLHPSTQTALTAYAHARDRLLPRRRIAAFFLSDQGRRITRCMAEWTYAQVSRSIGLRPPGKGHGRGPRLHDMRHTFAARTLIDWYRAGLDVEREIPKLATYLGHARVNETYWYIEAVPELLQLATQRLEKAATGSRP